MRFAFKKRQIDERASFNSRITFKKLTLDKSASSRDNFVFRKLTVDEVASYKPVAPGSIAFDLSSLELPSGIYTIVVTAIAIGFNESSGSTSVRLVIN